MAKLESKTSRGILAAEEYDDGIANGFRITINDELIALVDVFSNAETVEENEARILFYSDPDAEEPTGCIHINV